MVNPFWISGLAFRNNYQEPYTPTHKKKSVWNLNVTKKVFIFIIMLPCHEYRRTSWDNQFRPFELKTTTAMLWRWVQINQSHLKCSPKVLATVVCALRTIVTICTKNDNCHHRHLWEQLASELSWWWRLEATIILMTWSLFEEGSLSWVFLKLQNRGWFQNILIGIHLELRLKESE